MIQKSYEAVLIGCGAGKSTHPIVAAELYTSNYFRAKREWAMATGMPWAVLSAHHGLLRPETVTAPYDKSVAHFSRWERREWAARVSLQLFDWQCYIRVVAIIAGEAYMDPLAAALRALGVEVVNPCKGLGIGRQIAWLQAQSKREDR